MIFFFDKYLFANFVAVEALLWSCLDRAFSYLPLVGIWTIHG